jgi:uncharacterized protein (DUF433 family)
MKQVQDQILGEVRSAGLSVKNIVDVFDELNVEHIYYLIMVRPIRLLQPSNYLL